MRVLDFGQFQFNFRTLQMPFTDFTKFPLSGDLHPILQRRF